NRPGTSVTTVPAWKYEQVASVPETRRRPTPTSGVSSAKPVLRATTLMLRPWRSTATRTGEEPPGAARFLDFAPLPPTVQPAAGSAIETDPPVGDRSSSVAPVTDGSAGVPGLSGVRVRATQRSFCFSPERWILSFTPSMG